MTIFATRGKKMKVVIDGNCIAKKMKNEKFSSKQVLYTSKES